MKYDPAFLQLWGRALTFRARFEDYHSLDGRHLFWGLIVTWIVGMGRYWDDPRASFLQHLGIGSVLYVFVLAVLFWIIAKPLEPEHLSYKGILTFVVMTSPPAALYAIPVEQWMTLEAANQANLIFLGIVAAWRFSLWIHYLSQGSLMTGSGVFVCAIMPLGIIFAALYSMNLHHVVVDIMGGIRHADRSSQDAAYTVLLLFAALGIPLSGLAFFGWIGLVVGAWHDRRKARQISKTKPESGLK